MTAVHVVVPDAIDDPARPSGGNAYDRRVCRGLGALGWSVHEWAVAVSWPRGEPASRAHLSGALSQIPDDSVVMVDGLIASHVPEVLVPEAGRLRLVVLVHMPLGHGLPGDEVAAHSQRREREALSAAVAVVTTSAWTRRWLLDHYALHPHRVRVAEPGVDAAHLAPGTAAGGELLCVGAVTPGKGHDVLLAALAMVADLPWRCVCVGSLTCDPAFVDGLARQARDGDIAGRVHFAGPLTAADLDAAYAAADLLVLASRAETYGMVVTEGLARGLPVVATSVGGLPTALGRGADESRPGLLVCPSDPAAFAGALRCWLTDGALRQRLRDAAGERRARLPDWEATSLRIARVLAEVAA